MKRLLRIGVLCAMLVTVLCVSAFAAGEKGIYGATGESGFTVSANATAKGTQVIDVGTDGNQTVSLDAVSVTVTYSAATYTKEYLLMVTDVVMAPSANPKVMPTEGNIQYIQQSTASSSTVTFDNVYPKSLSSGKTYHIYLLSNDGGTLSLEAEAGSFKYYAARKLGDVDGDGGLSSVDALYVLQASVGNKPLSELERWAANVDGDDGLSSVDALYILQASVGNRNLE